MGSYTKRLIEQGSVDVFIVHQLNVDSLLHSSLGKNDSSHYQEIQPYLQLLCHYWADFDRFWSWANPPTIMSFEKIHQIFHLRFLLSSEYESFRKFLSAICCR